MGEGFRVKVPNDEGGSSRWLKAKMFVSPKLEGTLAVRQRTTKYFVPEKPSHG
jgi:hypothetical protein